VVMVQALSWRTGGTVVLCLELVPALVPVQAPFSKQTRDVALDQGHQMRGVASEDLKHLAEAWGMLVSKAPGTWSPPQIGSMLDQAGETTTREDTTMWVRELVASPKKPYRCLMVVDCGHVA